MEIKFNVADKNTKEVRDAVDNFKISEVDKLNAVCFWLIKQCNDTNADMMKVTQEGVSILGENIGNYEIVVNKIK